MDGWREEGGWCFDSWGIEGGLRFCLNGEGQQGFWDRELI